jgi:hypothetical protein
VKFFSRRSSNADENADEDSSTDAEVERGWLARLVRRHEFILGAAFVVVVLIGLGCWVGFGAAKAKSSLEQARASAQQAKEALLKGDTEAASKAAGEAYSHAQAAHDATHTLAWSIAANLPWLGGPLKTGQQISDVVLGLTSDVLQPAANIGVAISPDRIYQAGRLDVQLLRSEEPQLTKLAEAATRLNREATVIADPRYLLIMSNARTQLQRQISDLTQLLNNTALAARLVPSMLGADGPRTYFMGFQTNAEARGTGGLLGGFGILRFNNGAATVEKMGPNTALDKPFTPIDLGPEYTKQYGYVDPTTDYRNSNLSSHFPYAAQIWKSLWAQQSGENVDGVIAIDPVTLSYVLGAVGPITMPDGEVISKDNVVELTESTTYIRFPTDQVARKNYLQDIASAVVKKMTEHVSSGRQLLDALGRAVSEHRIAVWSSSPADQKLLEETPLAHEVPDDPGPYAGIVINNLGGNKVDYYLKTQIEYTADKCDGPTRSSTVTVKMTNAVPSDPLPDYVTNPQGLPPNLPYRVLKGTSVMSVRLLATDGAELGSTTLNGQRVPAYRGMERGHPIFEIQLAMPPGQGADLRFQLSEPTVPGVARVPVQPLRDSVTPVVSVPQCSK